MSYNISKDEKKVIIKVTDIEGTQNQLLENFNKCKEGSCECPTNEYAKLEGLDINSEASGITLELTPKEDAELNESELSACLDYSLKKTKSK